MPSTDIRRPGPALGVSFLLLLATLVGVGLALPVASDEDDDEGDDDNEGPGSNSSKGKNETHDGDDDDVDEEREGDRKPGRFTRSGNAIQGRSISFQLDQNTCLISDFVVKGVKFFDSIQLAGTCRTGDEESGEDDDQGSTLRVETTSAEIKLHDTPNGLLRFEAKQDGSIRFDVASGVNASFEGRTLNLSGGNLTARLFLNGGANVNWSAGVATVEDAKGNFIVHPANSDNPDRDEVRKAIRQGRVGGQVDILVENGTVVPDVMTLDDVVVRATRSNESTFRFVVDGNLTEGKVFVVNFAPGLFAQGKVGLRYYDLETGDALVKQVAIVQASDLHDVLSSTPGEGPEYWIVHDEHGTQVIVDVPHFSIHAFEVFSLPAAATPVILYGIVFGVLFVAVGAVGMFLGRRKTQG